MELHFQEFEGIVFKMACLPVYLLRKIRENVLKKRRLKVIPFIKLGAIFLDLVYIDF